MVQDTIVFAITTRDIPLHHHYMTLHMDILKYVGLPAFHLVRHDMATLAESGHRRVQLPPIGWCFYLLLPNHVQLYR